MTAAEFKIESPIDIATWFKYLSSKSEREGNTWFKDVGAKLHYEKFRNLYDNVYRCLESEGVDMKAFVSLYFTKPGAHSPAGLEAAAEDRCSGYFKNVRGYFAKTVRNVCSAMALKNVSSSMDILEILCKTGMLAPNFLSGRISVYWLAGVPGICKILENARRGWIANGGPGGRAFRHGDDFNFTFDRFLKQRDVYYHILCRAFYRMDVGVDSISVTDRMFNKTARMKKKTEV